MNNVMLITGASSGIGLELARVAARNGHNLALVSRNKSGLSQLAEELKKQGVGVSMYDCDLSNMNQVKELVSRVRKDGHKITEVINNAGVGLYGLFEGNDWDKVESMITVNITSLTYLTKAFLPNMKTAGYGRIMNVASTAAFQAGPYMAVYYATKAYVLSLSEATAEELKSSGITVTALCPGPTQSAFQKTAKISNSAGIFKGTLPTSKDVAEYGYSAMMSGKRIAIHGFKNRLGTLLVRVLPRKLVASIVAKASKPAN